MRSDRIVESNAHSGEALGPTLAFPKHSVGKCLCLLIGSNQKEYTYQQYYTYYHDEEGPQELLNYYD